MKDNNNFELIYPKLKPLILEVEYIYELTKHVIVVLDGRCASGKSSAAELLSKLFDAPIIHTDDFFLPSQKRTPERLEEPGGNTDYERFMCEVINKLSKSGEFEYGKFDCSAGRITHNVKIPNSDIVVVEGAYSMHPVYGDYGDITAFLDVDTDEQKRRILDRNGADLLEVFTSKWIPLEERYFELTRTRERADFVIRT